MTTLAKYETARRALADAHRVDEVKDIRDKAAAMQVYATQAKDRELIDMATDIKLRAERRAGELLREMPKNKGTQGAAKGRNSSGGHVVVPPEDTTSKLSDLGITKNESSRWQKLASMPEKEFEEKVTSLKSAMRAKTEGGSPKKSSPRSSPKPPEVKSRHEKIVLLSDAGMATREIATEVGVGQRMVDRVLEVENARREAIPDIDPTTLSMTAQQKLEVAIRQYKHKLAAEFHQRVNEGVQAFLMDTILPKHRKEQEEAKRIVDARRGIMDKQTFNSIRRCLHPDSRQSLSDKMLAQAFDAFMALEKRLLDEKDSPTTFHALPRNWEDWQRMKREATAARKAKYAASRTAVKAR